MDFWSAAMFRARLTSWIVSLGGLFVAGYCLPAVAADPIEGIAERMTREAVAAGVAGDSELRATTLAKVMELAPDYRPARWEAGQIEFEGEWMSVAAAQSVARTSSRLQKYSERRSSATDDLASQLALAQWCDEQGLADEAVYHWNRVLGFDPQHEQALARLDLVWWQGGHESKSEFQSRAEREKQARRELKQWNGRIDGWMRKMGGGESQQQFILDEMRRQIDESAIPAFEQLAGSPRGWKSSQGERRLALCKSFIEVIADRQTFEGTQTLVRHALLATHPELRDAALACLPERPQDETVPLLLSCLAAPVESRFDIRVTPNGRTVYTHELVTESRERNEVVEIAREGVVVDSGIPNAGTSLERRRDLAQLASGARRRSLQNFQAEAIAVERQVAQENAFRKVVNERTVVALRSITGKDLGSDPQEWWKDWQLTNGYEEQPYRPTTVYRDFYVTREVLPPPCECFVAGTLVWTKTGQQAIETLEPGDQVLAQDLATCELLFRPVLETTIREPSPMVRIQAGGETIVATEGHPFWLPGKGWRMARKLKPGDQLLTVDGPVTIDEVTAAPQNEAYNLIVSEHANYFVGTRGILVHDNTPREAGDVSQAVR
jgi:hypothetical protein